MVRKSSVVFLAVAALLAAGTLRPHAQGGAALTGTVSSSQEARMEGVLVTARRDGANFDISVVSDAQGKYSFPRSHVSPGHYTIKIRAVGFDLTSPGTVEVPEGKTATLDLMLDKAKDVSSQITSVEWLNSLTGSDDEKAMLQREIMSCTYCHSLERIIKSRHTAEQFMPVINRMATYYPDGSMAGTEGRGRAKLEGKEVAERVAKSPVWGYAPTVKKSDLVAYLASINMSGGRSLPADLKTLPRPQGKATRVIITQYDLPRKDTVPHDSDVDSKGNVWYTDQSDYYVGMLDAKTGTIKEWPLPKASTHAFGGASDVQIDRKDRPWFSVTNDKTPSNFGVPGRFDPQTGVWTPAQVEGEQFISQFNTLAPDGNIIQGTLKIDAETMKIIDRYEWANAPDPPPGPHIGYEPAIDSMGNWYITDFGSSYIIKVDGKTKAVKWIKTPTKFSEPRRGRVDKQNRYWFGEYTGDKIGMLDAKTEKITEFDTGMKWSSPYTSSVTDAKGRVYAPSNTSDRMFQLDPKTGEVVAFLMPTRDFDTKQVSIDPAGKFVWFANTRNARLVKIEPLD